MSLIRSMKPSCPTNRAHVADLCHLANCSVSNEGFELNARLACLFSVWISSLKLCLFVTPESLVKVFRFARWLLHSLYVWCLRIKRMTLVISLEAIASCNREGLAKSPCDVVEGVQRSSSSGSSTRLCTKFQYSLDV